MKKLGFTLSFLIFSALFLFVIFYHTHGIVPYDEGWFLQAGKRLLNGEKIYKDFEFLYNPGGAYLNKIAFKLLGESVLSSRIIAILNTTVSVIFLFKIFRKIELNGIISLILLFSFVFWGAGHINFIWPVMICLTFAIISIYLFISYSNKESYFLLGVLTFFTFFFKQNFGLAIFIANIISILLLNKEKFKKIKFYILGIVFLLIVQIIYFLNLGILSDYLKDIYFYTYVKIFKEGVLNSDLPWNYPAAIFIQFFKLVLYSSPILISLFSIYLVGNKKNLLYIPIIIICFSLLSIRPTTDFIHLTPLISLSLISLGLIYIQIKNLFTKLIILIFFVFVFSFGLYSSFYRNYYRWNPPLVGNKFYIENKHVKIWADKKEFENISFLENQLKSYHDEEVFIYNFAPIYYLTLDKNNATRFDYLHSGMISESNENEIIMDLNKKKTRIIISNINVFITRTKVARYILSKYKPIKSANEITVWKLD